MIKSEGQKRLRICIGLTQVHDANEIGPMFCEVIKGLGHEVWAAYYWDKSFLDADVLLLLGSFYKFGDFGKVLLDHNGKRPVTILWQSDPLPPVSLNSRAEKIGLQLGGLDWGRLGEHKSRIIRKFIPLSGKTCRFARWIFAQRLKREMVKSDSGISGNFDSSELFSVMAPYAWLKRHLNEGWIDHIIASTIPRLKFLRSRGINARFVPVGYHYRWGENLNLPRDIDVLFLGTTRCKRRRNILYAVQKELASRKIDLKIITRNCFSEERTRLLNRARIVLDIQRVPWDRGGMRFLMGMSCRSLIVSELLDDTAPYEEGVHFVQGRVMDLPDLICYYLSHDSQREAIVSSAYQFVTKELTLRKMVSQILGKCYEDKAVSAGCV
jgi:hypothetical protein